MAISNAIATKLNRMNRAAKDASLGTAVQTLQSQVGSVISGSVAVSTAQQSASAVVFYNALATQGGFLFGVTTGGSPLALVNYKTARSGGSLTIIPYNSGSFTVGDAVNSIIW